LHEPEGKRLPAFYSQRNWPRCSVFVPDFSRIGTLFRFRSALEITQTADKPWFAEEYGSAFVPEKGIEFGLVVNWGSVFPK
jgi:hypothetical protein